jgi:hypothetical protein
MPINKEFIGTFGVYDSTSNPQTLHPGDFTLAQNVSYQFQSQLIARHGHPDIQNTTSNYLGLNLQTAPVDKKWMGLYKWSKNGIDTYVMPLYSPTNTTTTYRNISVYKGANTSAIEGFNYTANGVVGTETEAPIFSQYADFVESQSTLFVLAANGVYTASDETTATPFSKFRQFFVPGFGNYPSIEGNSGATPLSITSSAVGWLSYSNGVLLKIVIVRTLNENTILESTPSNIIKVFNWNNRIGYPSLTIPFGASGFNLSSGDKVQIYRTKTFSYTSVAPTEYYLAVEKVYAGADLSFDLLLPDAVITSQQQIYVAPVNGGALNSNIAPPLATSMITHQGYTWYGEVTPVNFAKLGLLTLPSNGDTLTIRAGQAAGTSTSTSTGSNVTFTFRNLASYTPATATDVLIPYNMDATQFASNLYKTDSRSLSFLGEYGTAKLLAKIVPGNSDGQVRPYAQITATALAGGNMTFTFTPGLFDINKFGSSGAVYVCSSAGAVKGIFSYNTTTQTSTTLVCNNYKEETINAITYAANDYLYVLTNGGTVEGLQFYEGDGSSYYSLLPAINKFQTALGVLVKDTGSKLVDNTATHLIRCNFAGLTYKTQGELLDQQVNYFVNKFNATANMKTYALLDSQNVGVVVFQAKDPYDTGIYGLASAGSTFNPTLGASVTQFSTSTYTKNGIIASKYNRPQAVSTGYSLQPIRVGRNDGKILQLAATTTELYVFKEEGIYRITVTPTTDENATIESALIFDPTTQTKYGTTVQLSNNEIFFMSTQGIHKISNGQIFTISKPIEKDVVSWLGKLTRSGYIPIAVANQPKGYYLLTFPGVNADDSGLSMCYDTLLNKWSLWDKEFDQAYVDLTGKLTSITTDYALLASPTSTDSINVSFVDRSTPLWQYLRQDQFTGSTSDFVVDGGDLVYDGVEQVLATITQNYQPYSSDDQYDEAISLASCTITPVTSSTITVAFNSGGSYTKRFQNLRTWIYSVANKQVWLYASVSTTKVTTPVLKMWPVTITNATDSAGVATLYLTVLPDEQGGTVTSVSANTSSYLYVGVTVKLELAPYNSVSSGNSSVTGQNGVYLQPQHVGRPGTNKFFSEFQLVSDISPSYVGYEMKVDSQANYTAAQYFSKSISVKSVYRTNVPLAACRGVYLIVRVGHSTPKELFKLQGVMYSMRDTDSQLSMLK